MEAIKLNKELFDKYSGDKEKPLLVEFWAPWCVYCRRIAPAMKKITEEYGGDIIIGEVNIDDNPDLERDEQIEIVPTFVLYKGGQAVHSIVAPESKAKIEEFIREGLAK